MTRILTLTMALALAAAGSAFAQNNTTSGASNSSSNTGDTTPSAPSTSSDKHSARGKHTGSQHHAAMHHAARHGENAMDHRDVAYRNELRRCVEGPANNRDSCLDQAIAQHQRG